MSATIDALNDARPKAPAKRGFAGVPCIRCGSDARVYVHLDDLTTFHCGECEAEFTEADVHAHIDRWAGVLRWTSTGPLLEAPQ